jgi:outer membrane protein OmpA-like peptidoglycan-associated protein
MKRSLFLLFLSVFTLSAWSQGGKLKEADRHFDYTQWRAALEDYKEFKKEEKGNVPERVHKRIAICKRELKMYQSALESYQELYKEGMLSKDGLLEYGHLLRNHEKYGKAQKVYQDFADKNPDDPRGYYYKEAASWAEKNPQKDPAYRLEELGLETGGTSLGQWPNDGELLFATPKRVKGGDGEMFTYDIVKAEYEDGSFSEHRKLKGNVNNEANQGTPCLLKREDANDLLYYSSNASEKVADVNVEKREKYGISEDYVNRLGIKVAEKKNGRWKKKDNLSFNDPVYDQAQPYVTRGGDSLFFVSNKKEGVGKFDIYLATRTDTGWSEPENLGDHINTRHNEMYPYWHEGTLYFSSYGHFNYGGSDIFKCEYDEEKDEWGSVENMGRPVNSSRDDFAYVLTSDPDSGLFSSNRNTDPAKDRIFTWKDRQLPDTIRGIARNRINSQPISGVKVTLFHDEETVSEQTTNETGKCKLILEQDTKYRVRFKKEGYEKKEYDIPKNEREDVIALLNSIELDPKPTKDKIIELDRIYFDYGSAELRPDGKETLDKLYGYMKDHPKARIELSAHTDAQSSAEFNMKLSERRAQSCYDYLKEKGMNTDRMVPKGYGETRLLNDCTDGVECPEEKHQENRRVEIKFLEKGTGS